MPRFAPPLPPSIAGGLEAYSLENCLLTSFSFHSIVLPSVDSDEKCILALAHNIGEAIDLAGQLSEAYALADTLPGQDICLAPVEVPFDLRRVL